MKRFFGWVIGKIKEDPLAVSLWLIEEAMDLCTEQELRFGDHKGGEQKSRKVRALLMKRYPTMDKWYINLAIEVAVGRLKGRWL